MSSEDDDVIGELVRTIKDLSDKNFSLALKVNELEKKIEQTEQIKNDINSLKSNVDAANTDRTAIKDLLNLKIAESNKVVEEKVNSVKKDMAFFKEDLNKIDSENIEIKNTIKKISDETVKNFESIKSDYTSKIQNNTDFSNQVRLAVDKINEDVSKGLESVSKTFQESLDTLRNQVLALDEDLTSKFQSADNQQAESTAEQFERSASETATELQRLTEDMESKVQQLKEEVTVKFDNQQSLLTNLSSQTDMSVNSIKKELDKFFEISDNHSSVLKVFEEIIGQIHANIEQASLEVKKDQELLLESFQKIIVGQAENLRNELLTFSKEIRTNLSKFNEDTASKYTSIDETAKVNERIKSLDNDLHTRSENIRKQLIETLEENIQKFDSSIKNSISSVEEYRVDLERFKDDIESLIERKVNEKTEFSMELFNNLLTKAEHISKLIQDSRVSKVPKISVPIPEIKDSSSEENQG